MIKYNEDEVEVYNYTLSEHYYSMKFTQFKINGTIEVKFSENMIDQKSGFNISMLNEGLMILNISLS